MKWYGQFDPPVDKVAWGYFPEGYAGHAVGVGECDGIFYSNTYAFELAGWTCLCIEPNPEWQAALQRNRKHVQPYAISNKTGTAILTVYDIKQGDHSALTGIATDKRLVDGYGGTVVREVEVPTRTLNDAIYESGLFYTVCKDLDVGSSHLDYVSIDTEGNELQVLEGFQIWHWMPTLVVVENNYDDVEIPDYMKKVGYKRDRRVGVNDFYVKA